MVKNSAQININLTGKPKKSISNIFFSWVVNIGRIIIVGTELIALGALFYRFTLDRKIIDLHEKITRADTFVKGKASKEKEYRSIQYLLSKIKEVNDETEFKVSVINEILQYFNDGTFTATNLSISDNIIMVNATAFSVFQINSFTESLGENPNVIGISLDEVTSTNTGIKFKVNIELKQTKST